MHLLTAVPLLIIDDFGMRKLPITAAEDLLEIVMRRYERASTLLSSQLSSGGLEVQSTTETRRRARHSNAARQVEAGTDRIGPQKVHFDNLHSSSGLKSWMIRVGMCLIPNAIRFSLDGGSVESEGGGWYAIGPGVKIYSIHRRPL